MDGERGIKKYLVLVYSKGRTVETPGLKREFKVKKNYFINVKSFEEKNPRSRFYVYYFIFNF